MESSSASEVEFLTGLDLAISAPERALICMRDSCGYAIQVHDSRVSRHLWEKHQIPKIQRRGVDKAVASLHLTDPRRIPPFADGSSPHRLLRQCRGFACRHCSYRTISSKLIQQHLYKSPSCAQIQIGALGESIVDEVWLQSWTVEGARQYWITRNESGTVSSSSEGPHHQSLRLESILEAERGRISKSRNQQHWRASPQCSMPCASPASNPSWCCQTLPLSVDKIKISSSRGLPALNGFHRGLIRRYRGIPFSIVFSDILHVFLSLCQEPQRLEPSPAETITI
jgi:hypothetical protein